MKALLYKEFKLAIHPTVFIFNLLATMLLIPSYPYYVSFYYTCLGVFFIFINGRETKDILYTSLLPIRKRDCVRARLMTVSVIELFQLVISVPIAIISMRINPNAGGNPVGIEPNVAFFGLVLVMYSIFNLICLPAFYKTAYNIGKPFFIASVVIFLYIGAAETLVHLPVESLKTYLDTTDSAMMIKQLPVLAAGMLIYALSMTAVWKISARRFDTVDL